LSNKTRLHLIVYEQGAGAAVVATIEDSDRVEIAETPPPNHREFIETQLFLICEGDHVLWTCHNSALRVASVSALLERLFDAFLKREQIPGLFLLAIADTNKYVGLLADGIGCIELDFFGYREAFEYAKQHGKLEKAGWFSDLIGFMLSDDDSSEVMNRMKTRVILKPGRDWAVPSIKTHLSHIAKTALTNVSEGSEVTIVTKSGNKIKSSELLVKEIIDVDGNRRLLDVQGTFQAIEQVYTNLIRQNLV